MSMVQTLLLVFGLVFCLVLPQVVQAQEIYEQDVIGEQIYTSLKDGSPCVKLLTKNGPAGCWTPEPLTGTIRLVESVAQYEALLEDQSSPVTVALAPRLFSRERVDRLAKELDLAGILVLTTQETRRAAWSPDSAYPNELHPTNESFAWNPAGDSLLLQPYKFGIISLSDAETEYIQLLGSTNENLVEAGDFPYYSAEFSYNMDAHTDSETCLSQGHCFPVGGYSVWGSFSPLDAANATDAGVVLLTTNFDSTAFFHYDAIGADADMTGLTVLLETISLLAKTLQRYNTTKRIVFALFDGESYSNVGSRRFATDLKQFHCKEWASGGPTTNRCQVPFQASTAFTDLPFTSLDAIIEVKQIGLNNTLFTHADPASCGDEDTTTAVLQALQASADTIPHLSLRDSTPLGLGLPPSSSRAFCAGDGPAIVVLTDHQAAYENEHYHSIYDNRKNSNPDSNHLCRAATLLARTAFSYAGGDLTTDQTVLELLEADCLQTIDMYQCLTEDLSCPLIKHYAGLSSDPNHYTGIFQLMEYRYISGMPTFLHAYATEKLSNFTLAQTSSKPLVNYHDAVDPALVMDYTTHMWTVNKSALHDTHLWTESNWPSYSTSGMDQQYTRVFRVETPADETLMLIAGVVTLGVAFLSGRWILYCSAKRFKVI